jgi:flagellar hook-associated protein 2
MAGLQLGGLTSGLDTQSIIGQLIAVDRQPETRMKLQESALQARSRR